MNISLLIIPILSLSYAICLSDITRREIPNYLNKSLLILSSLQSIYLGYFNHSFVVFIVFLSIFFPLWLFNFFGGGDIKLVCVFSLAIHPSFSLLYIVSIGFIGAAQVVIMMLFYKKNGRAIFENGIPYGIPICISGVSFCVLSALYIGTL